MSQPPPYSRSFSFTNYQATNPSAPVPGSQVDLELNNAKATLDAVLANLKLIQRDDGGIKNATIGLDQLKAEVPVGFNAPVAWTTGTAFTAGSSTVFQGSGFYRCLVTHTSGVFATDLAAGKWQLIVNLAAVPLVNASQIAVTPSGSLTSDVQTSLQALDTGKAATSHTHPSSAISDSTAAGRALLTAADVNAQNALLGTALLGFQAGDIKETACPILQSGWYYCDGSAKNRVTDVNLFNAITIQQSGTLTNASAVVAGLSDTSNLSAGMPVSGTGVSAGTVVASVDSGTQVTLSANATASSTTTLIFAPYGIGDGSTTFNLPNRAYVGVGRDNASGSASNITQVSTTINTTNAFTTATVGSATGLAAGMYVAAAGVPFGTQISSISGTSIVLSNAATVTASGVAARFSPLPNAQGLGRTGGALSMSTTLITANLPPYTPAGSVSGSVTSITLNARTASTAGSNDPSTLSISTFSGTALGGISAPFASGTLSASFTGSAQGGTSAPIVRPNMQPTIVMNYIIKR
jgi:hypothetical protein